MQVIYYELEYRVKNYSFEVVWLATAICVTSRGFVKTAGFYCHLLSILKLCLSKNSRCGNHNPVLDNSRMFWSWIIRLQYQVWVGAIAAPPVGSRVKTYTGNTNTIASNDLIAPPLPPIIRNNSTNNFIKKDSNLIGSNKSDWGPFTFDLQQWESRLGTVTASISWAMWQLIENQPTEIGDAMNMIIYAN